MFGHIHNMSGASIKNCGAIVFDINIMKEEQLASTRYFSFHSSLNPYLGTGPEINAFRVMVQISLFRKLSLCIPN